VRYQKAAKTGKGALAQKKSKIVLPWKKRTKKL